MPDFLLPLAALAFPNIDPVIFEIGPFTVFGYTIGPLGIHWYGVAYIAGILFSWWYAKRLVANAKLWPPGHMSMKPEDLDDFVLWAAVGVVLGGRVGYILFYDLARYIDNPLDVFAVWEGGMSFHGGFLGTTIAMVLFARARGINVLTMFDVIAATAPVGFGLVRCTNFINAELWGRITDVPWAVVFPQSEPFARHPSQLYEAALEGLVLFFVLRFVTHRLKKLGSPGFVTGVFIIGYGSARIFVEFFREPDAQIGYLLGGWLTMGMVLSAPMVLLGVWLLATARPIAVPRPT